MIIAFIVALVSFIALDVIGLGFVLAGVYRDGLGAHVSIVNGSIQVNYWAALVVYLLEAAGLCYFVFRHGPMSTGQAMLAGALLGFIVFGVYDFTNASVLTAYPWRLVAVDILWGTFATTVVAAIVNTVLSRMA